MDEEVRREIDELRRRVTELENRLARFAGPVPIDPMPETNPLRHPQPPQPGDFPNATT